MADGLSVVGKRKTLAIGVYPAVSLVDARKKRDQARELLVKNVDPSMAKAVSKQIICTAAENTFKAVALEWHAKTSKTWAETTSSNIKRYLEKDIFPRAERDPSSDLRGALTPVKVKHHASITDPKGIGALLRSIHGFSGSYITKCATACPVGIRASR